MPPKRRPNRASRYAELARDRGRRSAAPPPPPMQRPAFDRAPVAAFPRPRPSAQPVTVLDQRFVAGELQRIGIVSGLMLALLVGLSLLLG